MKHWTQWLVAVGFWMFWAGAVPAQPSATNDTGLRLTLQAGAESDSVVVPNVWLHVPRGGYVSPFVAGKNFTATWEGTLAVELRGEFLFRAEAAGKVKVEINGATVLQFATNSAGSGTTGGVKLAKGENALRVTFQNDPSCDAVLRLLWSEKGVLWEPLPNATLRYKEDKGLVRGRMLRHGRELAIEHRCFKCHAGASHASAIPELAMDAPSFEEIGARRKFSWLAEWIENPRRLRSTAHMPAFFHGPEAKEQSVAIATFLASLKGSGPDLGEPAKGDLVEPGQKLVTSLNCSGCHNLPGETKADEKKISLARVGEKFSAGALVTFLLKPDAHYLWIRMPNFKLSPVEAAQIAAVLLRGAAQADGANPADPAKALKGKEIVQTSGCLNCHALKMENRFRMAPLAADRLGRGCLAEKPEGKAPDFGFGASEREALAAVMQGGAGSFTRHVPSEFAERQTRLLNCGACHGVIEGFPALEIVGGKLKPEWAARFIGGKIGYKPRPWLEARMPAFASRSELLAEGLAAQHGYPPKTPPEPAIDSQLAKTGQKLVSADGGFACISCHAVGAVAATQVFESEGLNLAYPGERLLPQYFQRWVRNPPRMDPATKMPVYFDEEGKSPLADILGGDASRQIEALWQYLRLGDKVPPPTQAQ